MFFVLIQVSWPRAAGQGAQQGAVGAALWLAAGGGICRL